MARGPARGVPAFPAALAALAMVVAVAACAPSRPVAGPATGSEPHPDRGLEAIERHGCAACHAIPGVREDRASYVAPPLDRFGRRAFIAGTLPNTHDNLVRWLLDPDAVEPGTAMPDVGLTRAEAADIAAYLHGLR